MDYVIIVRDRFRANPDNENDPFPAVLPSQYGKINRLAANTVLHPKMIPYNIESEICILIVD